MVRYREKFISWTDAFRVASTQHRGFVQRELKAHAAFFDTVESHPLTLQQRKAIILDEPRSLVVAAAGTGKTSVIVAKVGYLLRKQLCDAGQICLLAFNSAAAKEMRERLDARLGEIASNVEVKTFHSLGNAIIAHVEGAKPSLSKLAEDPRALQEELVAILGELVTDHDTGPLIRRWFLEHARVYKAEHEIETREEYVQLMKSAGRRTLGGELVKSFSELDIANFFYEQGVEYRYEAKYEHPTATRDFRQYQPDFYLPEYEVYVEHFGVDRKEEPALFVDRERYLDGMEWKREIHRRHGTTLVETYSYEHSEGTLIEGLKRKLEAATGGAIRYRPVPSNELFERLNSSGYTSLLTSLIATFIAHFKSADLRIEELRAKAGLLSGQHRRGNVFVDVFELFLQRYEARLTGVGDIDFADMSGKSIAYLRDGRYLHPYRYLIVDEFQDVSLGRYRQLQEMLQQRADCRLYAVGDDWQSIYRFAGSDVRIMTRFRNAFQRTPTGERQRARSVDLDETFRFNDRIAKASEIFIQRNRAQLPKAVRTRRKALDPALYLHDVVDPGDEALRAVIDRLQPGTAEAPRSVLILARYNRDLPNHMPRRDGLTFSAMTIHRSKGLEADYVIVTDLVGGMGNALDFPSTREDDPLLELILPDGDAYPHAEERRLLYVALTRARNQVHLIGSSTQLSPFFLELQEKPYRAKLISERPAATPHCPTCRTGVILDRRPKASFFGCSNFPLCDALPACPCPECNTGCLEPVRSGTGRHATVLRYDCSNPSCTFVAKPCAKCLRAPRAVPRKNTRSGETFLGCFAWPDCRPVGA